MRARDGVLRNFFEIRVLAIYGNCHMFPYDLHEIQCELRVGEIEF